MKTVTFKIWRGDATGGKLVDYTTEITEGLVVLDVVHKTERRRRTISRAAGIARPANAAPVPPRLQRHPGSSCA